MEKARKKIGSITFSAEITSAIIAGRANSLNPKSQPNFGSEIERIKKSQKKTCTFMNFQLKSNEKLTGEDFSTY